MIIDSGLLFVPPCTSGVFVYPNIVRKRLILLLIIHLLMLMLHTYIHT